MASSFYSNSQHVDFESVLTIEDPGMDGLVVSTVNGVPIEISEQLLAETFELPVDGLSELSEMPKDKLYDARSIISLSGEPVNLSGRKVEKFALLTAVVCGVNMNWASVLFNIFKKMVTPGAKQAKGYAVQISQLLENIPNLNLGESLEFPVSKILTVRRKLHTQITAATIDQNDMQREVKDLNAKVDAIATNLERVKRDAEATKEAIFHQLFEFQSQAQANHIILTTQLGLLVDGLNRGGNDKRGKEIAAEDQNLLLFASNAALCPLLNYLLMTKAVVAFEQRLLWIEINLSV
ncbi:pentatricopeptide repeat-containing protein-like [Dorcoceras hygrometricum]|uniref:Pentatricopeptide repeat-containing protein-like n=1 Tax=Dorcoceras hygrometricum TaxID=472368 RepID=A0A2Z7CRK1_9LAMI|nr:pentatricopeptide repeat-containing protein-like [Dorcoceras hygrometricum]